MVPNVGLNSLPRFSNCVYFVYMASVIYYRRFNCSKSPIGLVEYALSSQDGFILCDIPDDMRDT